MVVLGDLARIHPPVTRHAEVKDERVASIGFDEPIFRTPPKSRHTRAGQPLAKINRKSSPKIGPPGFNTGNAVALEHARQSANGGFDFRKFGHSGAIWRTAAKPARGTGRMKTQVNFGDELVSPDEKTRRVGAVFSSVARRYDIMNDLMSGGMHRLWKNRFVARVKPRPGEDILDMAGGTGDVAFRMARRGAHVTIADINADMLEVGKERARLHSLSALDWKIEDAEALSFADATFDAYTIVFGIRNVTDIPAALREAHRVLKRGGRFYCMEFASSDWPGFSNLYDAWASNVIPRIGKAVAHDEDSYRYLVESIRRFPRPETFKRMVADAGFVRPAAEPMLGGLVTIHSGWKI
jgi:demethylmenaquinone methyltransferase/2-methoxy-6-polyprenyl-1,4-benzoquinol methylase